MNLAPPSSRRRFLGRLAGLALAVGLGAAAAAHAPQAAAQPGGRQQPGRGRLDQDERDRLRRDLRERGFEGWPRREAEPERGAGRGFGGPGRDPGFGQPGRLSDDERQQLRRQLREAGRRRN
ncbi:hypothetical protein M6I34_01310 [Burkholderiaceae bacterium FT117]|uniref:hypothetical protein n=1 Tax=Zeimonas sediminis TaxID=2944268 RepID=UPI0023431139|nr:hypothetical protein [Zeimonas sediminis]MCM5569139.1 hypothetical protein [Zeimonas sediminis]